MASITLKDLAGTGRGLGSLTVDELEALVEKAKVSGVTKSARRQTQGAKGKAAKTERVKATKGKTPKAQPKNEFYENVIVGQREEREKRQRVNREAAAWMREHGLVPQGQAWSAVKNGERGIKKLQALNVADGLAPMVAKGAEAKAKQAEAKPAVREGSRHTRTPKAKEAKAKERQDAQAFDKEAQIETLMAGGFTRDEAVAALS